MIFLYGPPGAGKTSLGTRVCGELGLTFVDVGSTSSRAAEEERLRDVVDARAADVVEIPWRIQSNRRVLTLTRRAGATVALWAHPVDMMARCDQGPLVRLTPIRPLKSGGGFGTSGVACREFRQLERSCSRTLLLVDLTFDNAARVTRDCFSAMRHPDNRPPAERERIHRWVELWHRDYDTDRDVAAAIVDAMGRYLAHLRSGGASPRSMNNIRMDLEAAGHLVLMYSAPTVSDALRHFSVPPHTFEYGRRFSDSPTQNARYRRSLRGFARYLREEHASTEAQR